MSPPGQHSTTSLPQEAVFKAEQDAEIEKHKYDLHQPLLAFLTQEDFYAFLVWVAKREPFGVGVEDVQKTFEFDFRATSREEELGIVNWNEGHIHPDERSLFPTEYPCALITAVIFTDQEENELFVYQNSFTKAIYEATMR